MLRISNSLPVNGSVGFDGRDGALVSLSTLLAAEGNLSLRFSSLRAVVILPLLREKAGSRVLGRWSGAGGHEWMTDWRITQIRGNE